MEHRSLKVSTLALAVALTLTACGSDKKNPAPVAADVMLKDIKEWVATNGKFNANDTESLTLSLSQNGVALVKDADGYYATVAGMLKVDGMNFSYISITGENEVIDFQVADSKEQKASAKLHISDVKSDPLANQQWHLHNTGQLAYSQSANYLYALATLILGEDASEAELKAWMAQRAAALANAKVTLAGEDMSVLQAHSQGITGKGSIAVIVDSGVEILHEDLIDNVLPGRSLNLMPGVVDRTNPANLSEEDDFHGTAVAGIVAATAWNGKGGRGVAPEAKLIGVNYLEAQEKASDYELATAVYGLPGSGITTDENVVFNRSYGANPPYFLPEDAVSDELYGYAATELRNGKGALSVNAAGNDFENGRANGDYCEVSGVNDVGLSCIDVNVSSDNRNLGQITIGAVRANGKKSSYSTTGSALWVAAPGGEYGTSSPAIISTDPMTCLRGGASFAGWDWAIKDYGFNFAAGYGNFNFPGMHDANPSCNYLSMMNGTSAAAPNVTGVVALMMEANPNLSQREIRHILAATADQNDPDNAPVLLPIGEESYTAHQGWFTNKAGYHFNNFYGFGRVNAGKAVAMAKSFNTPFGEQLTVAADAGSQLDAKAPLNLTIANNSLTGASATIEVTDDLTIENMQFNFTITNSEFQTMDTPQLSGYVISSAGTDLAIEVTSPQGTKAVILSSNHAHLFPAITDAYKLAQGYVYLPNVKFLANAFYGEKSKGTWTVTVRDVRNPNTVVYTDRWGDTSAVIPNTVESVLQGWGLTVVGRQ